MNDEDLKRVKDKLQKEKEERYKNILDYWKNRKPFENENDIPDIPIVLPKDYQDIIIPNIIRCGGIPKCKLEVGKTYAGSCRNASEAIWDGTKFTYMRTKFGTTYPENINHFEDDDKSDLFIPIKKKQDMKEEIIYFEINDWFAGRDFPNDEIFGKWINDCQFRDNDWCKENKLCVMCGAIDMSMNYCIAAPRSWVEKNCPKMLGDDEYTYTIRRQSWIPEKNDWEAIDTEHKKKYSDFRCYPDEDGDVYGKNDDWLFPEYCEENFGVTFNNSWWGD